MTHLARARLWLGAAGVGAVVFAVSLAAMVRSCEMARLAHAEVVSFAELRVRLAEIQRSHHAVSAPR